jgi:hypothetical protein
MEDKTLKSLLSKLRQPVHISYISKYILKKEERETELELNKLMEEGLIQESHMSKGYYVVKNQE